MTRDLLERPDFIPLSYLNQFLYCPRRFWLMFVEGEMDVNAVLLDGTQKHRNAHAPGVNWHPDGRLYSAVWVWSGALRVAGIADFVQENEEAHLIPIEHKRGRMGQHLSDHVQLCAQAMCLEERTGQSVPNGEIFYWANRRREQVAFSDRLREMTHQTAEQIYALLETGYCPDPINHPAKCRDCSLEPICLPKEVLMLKGSDR